MIKTKYLVSVVVVVGFFVLLFFPEPESNFLMYMSTALAFVGLITFILLKNKK